MTKQTRIGSLSQLKRNECVWVRGVGGVEKKLAFLLFSTNTHSHIYIWRWRRWRARSQQGPHILSLSFLWAWNCWMAGWLLVATCVTRHDLSSHSTRDYENDDGDENGRHWPNVHTRRTMAPDEWRESGAAHEGSGKNFDIWLSYQFKNFKNLSE